MIPAAFEYHQPGSVKEACALLAKLGEDAHFLAGGHSFIIGMRLCPPARKCASSPSLASSAQASATLPG